MADKDTLLGEYINILSGRFKNSNKFIVEIKASQAAIKKMQLEQAGASVAELKSALTEAKKDAVCYLLMELGEFLGDQQMVKASKATRAFMQWGIKQIIVKLKELGIEMSENEIRELTIDACLARIEKLKENRLELETKLMMAEGAAEAYSI
ncbi:MAG: hypothetical protein WC490_04860 [Candidatus Margulisiibacteriota bacterium]